jgi:hypothetical protein
MTITDRTHLDTFLTTIDAWPNQQDKEFAITD